VSTRSVPVYYRADPRLAAGVHVGYYVTDTAIKAHTIITLYDVEPPCATKKVEAYVAERWTTDERGKPVQQPYLSTTVTPNILRKFKNFRPLV
jgi:hypothetical protein